MLEWLRTWFLGGFPWLPLAASQWQRTALLQIAAFTGAGGVSFVLIVVNLGFAAVAHRLFRAGRPAGLLRRSPEFLVALVPAVACVHHATDARRRSTAGGSAGSLPTSPLCSPTSRRR